MYDAKIGRWLEEDPDGFAAGDANLFRYVGNDSTNATDPTGKSAIGVCFPGSIDIALNNRSVVDPINLSLIEQAKKQGKTGAVKSFKRVIDKYPDALPEKPKKGDAVYLWDIHTDITFENDKDHSPALCATRQFRKTKFTYRRGGKVLQEYEDKMYQPETTYEYRGLVTNNASFRDTPGFLLPVDPEKGDKIEVEHTFRFEVKDLSTGFIIVATGPTKISLTGTWPLDLKTAYNEKLPIDDKQK
jgi:hypothetical protein